MPIDNTYYAYNVARADLDHMIDRFSYVNGLLGYIHTEWCDVNITMHYEHTRKEWSSNMCKYLKCAITMKCKNIFVKVI